MKEFKDILKELRKSQNLTQEELAGKLDISRSTEGSYERGDRTPTVEGFEALADIFNVDMDYLYGKTDVRKKVMFDGDGTQYSHVDSEEGKLNSFLKMNPGHKALFDSITKVKKEDVDFIKTMLDKFSDK